MELGLGMDEIWVEEPRKGNWDNCKAGSGAKRSARLGQRIHIRGNQAIRGEEKQCGTLLGRILGAKVRIWGLLRVMESPREMR